MRSTVVLAAALFALGCGRAGRSGTGDDDDDSATSDDDTVGDDDTGSDDDATGDDDSTAGDDDTTPGDDDTTPGDDDSTPSDDDTAGDDDTTPADDDTTGDDDTPPGDDDDSTPAVWGDLIFTEVQANPAVVTDAVGEWFELRSLVSWPIDLSGWTVADQGSDSFVVSPGVPLVVPAMGWVTLGVSADTSVNGLVPVAFAYGTDLYLSNTSDEILLTDPSGTLVASLVYGLVGWPNSEGRSSMLSADAMDEISAADYFNWCVTDAAYPYGLGDLGTPSAANPTCF